MKRLIFLLISLSPALGYQESVLPNRASHQLLSEVQQLMHEGHYAQAQERLESAPHTDPFVLRLLLELARREGREDETNTYARRLLGLYQSRQLRGSEEIAEAAYAAWQLDLFQDANQLFIEAGKIKPTAVSMFVDWGHLYLAKYNAAEAESIFQDGIKSSQPSSQYLRWGEDAAYVGLAKALNSQFKPGVAEALEKALELNPQNLEAFAFKALLAIEKKQWEEAREWIEKGLAINDLYLPLLELQCAFEYFRENREAFERTRQQVLNINPNDGDLFETLGDLATRQRRFEKGIEFYREALEHNPRQESARASLGVNLLRLGQEEEGKQVLEVAYANDPFNIWTVNTLRLLDSLDRFVRFETPHFRVKLHEKEAAALRPYVEELTERSLSTLEQKYNHQISGKYVFEMYPDHADFAVRTLGLPGLGALGAAFGRVVAMDSPSARPNGEFHWGSTLWHEMAHVVTLSLSDNRVPRWFTEGISMMEERQAGAGWGEYLNVGFVRAYENDDLLPLSDLNSGFEHPKSPQQLGISYFQAGWICEFLALRYGISEIRAMLEAFAKGGSTEEVFQQVLGASVEEIDQQFRQELDKSLKPLLASLQAPGDSPLQNILQGERQGPGESEDTLEDLFQSWQSSPDNYFLNLRLGATLKSVDRLQEAIPYLEKAIELFPTQAGKASPYPLLTEIYEELGQIDKALGVRQRWWSAAPLFIENVHRLASLLSDQNRLQEAAQYLEEAMYVNPLQPDTHERLGEIYLQSSQFEKAVREFEVFVSLTSVDMAAAHYKLAQALFQLGDTQGAHNHVLLSLEIAPAYQEAQRLLLKLVRR